MNRAGQVGKAGTEGAYRKCQANIQVPEITQYKSGQQNTNGHSDAIAQIITVYKTSELFSVIHGKGLLIEKPQPLKRDCSYNELVI